MSWDREIHRRSMDSPGVLFFRVMVMLACLILVPMAAIFGSAFPDLVKTTLVDRITKLVGVNLEWNKTATSTPHVDEAPRFQTTGDQTQPWKTAESAPAWQGQTAMQANYTAPPEVAAANTAEPWQPAPRGGSAAPAFATTAAAMPSPGTDHFTEIQRRLREYGAIHYALETAGQHGELYRFTCTFPAADGRPMQFAVTDRDPLQAMSQVLTQVDAWRAGR
jgi:hypothetical protein